MTLNCSDILQWYHSYNLVNRSSRDLDLSEWWKIKVGFEIERDSFLSYEHCVILQNDWWRCERDGSVRGWEYITPILDMNKAYEFIEKYSFVLNWTNNSNRCWWHIHISIEGKNTDKIYNNIEWFRPVLWGLYPQRALRNYSNRFNSKYSHSVDVWVRERTVEFRIFPILRSLNQVRFRLALIRFFITNVWNTKEQALNVINEKSVEFLSILHISYPTIRKKINVIKRIIKAYEIDVAEEKNIIAYLRKQCDELEK